MIQLDKEITESVLYSFDFKMNYNALFPVYIMDLALKSKKFIELINADVKFSLEFQNTKKATMYFPKVEWDKGAQYLLDNLQKKRIF